MIVEGVVVSGKHLGRRLGFPTANVQPERVEGEWLPNGVYAAAFWPEGSPKALLCMLNQGVHPTVPEGPPTIEACLTDYSGDLYGERVRVEYLCFLRPEQRFDGLEALKAQLRRDYAWTRCWLADALAGQDVPGAARAAQIAWQTPDGEGDDGGPL